MRRCKWPANDSDRIRRLMKFASRYQLKVEQPESVNRQHATGKCCWYGECFWCLRFLKHNKRLLRIWLTLHKLLRNYSSEASIERREDHLSQVRIVPYLLSRQWELWWNSVPSSVTVETSSGSDLKAEGGDLTRVWKIDLKISLIRIMCQFDEILIWFRIKDSTLRQF